MFRTILIANRGEIACRVIRTARRMGIASVAVFSDADADAAHVRLADAAYRLGPAAPRDSYLRGDLILDIARRSGAQAIHPGYGFLSENAGFAEACAAAGVVFIGPPPGAIRAMGGKSEAKALMQRAGVRLVPGYHGADQDPALLQAEADGIGYPVLIKASAGGGGKGMRIVREAGAFAAALDGARREARSSFGDDRVLVERYLQRPRHVEIQVFADTHGNVVSLFERDCSIQRRHQKIIEEAPAPGMSATMRRAMGEAAIAAARAVDYVGAGTVEFIVEDEDFHFMEMNTRLQVEHPVTEAITGQDLVEWQLRVAAGQRLPLLQEDLAIAGHAIEVRLYAEDPAAGFLPSIGRLAHLSLPAEARIESGVRAGDSITPDYDPMIAKLIVAGADRAEALRRLSAALARAEVVGVRTNLALLRRIAAHPAFVAGDFDTGFIARFEAELMAAPATPPAAIAAAALWVLAQAPASPKGDPHSPWSDGDAWRMNLPGSRSLAFDGTGAIAATRAGDAWTLAWEGGGGTARLTEGGLRLDDAQIRATLVPIAGGVSVLLDGANHDFRLLDPLQPPHAEAVGGGRVMAPIPGRITAVLVAPGDSVGRGQALLVLEAMKMELTLTAAADGVVDTLRCALGDMVSEGVDLVTFLPDATSKRRRSHLKRT